MGVTPALDKSDVVRLLRLLNDLHETPGSADARGRAFLAGACDLVNASAGVITVRRAARATNGAAATHADGWSIAHRHALDAGPAALLTRAADLLAPTAAAALTTAADRHDPAFARLLRRARALRPGTTLTLTRRDLLPDDDAWYAHRHVRDVRRPLGVDDCVYSALTLSPDHRAVLYAFRPWPRTRTRRGRAAFGPRERTLIDLAHQGAAWVYRAAAAATAAADVGDARIDALPLSPREKQTLRELLAGRGDKQIAATMRLSTNTVHHYVKEIYKHLGVSSRAELLAKWLGNEG